VRAHVVEVGPNAIRRLCCGGGTVVDEEAERAALEGIDDPTTLVDLRPVAVASLWRTVLGSVDCGSPESAIVVHPSWWAPPRVDVVSAAAQMLAGDVVMRPRSWLLRQAVPPESQDATLVVEIADGFVVITGATVAAETRRRDQQDVAEKVVRSIRAMASDATETVVIDAPRAVHGAGALAAMIVKALRDLGGMTAVHVDDIGLRKLVAGLIPVSTHDLVSSCNAAARPARRRWKLALATLLTSGVLGVSALAHHAAPHADDGMPTSFLVEGHVALEVPAQWSVRRVVAGPGSARLQITSPSDPEVALHVTQSRVALSTLAATAEFLKIAIDAAPTGVFIDFNPVGRTAGRPAVTYREIRSGHDIQWAVWVDRAVRISIGCQSRHDHDDAVGQECELAVRSARALDSGSV
jgi:type VII secretion-associated protein (TIGR03931 family)